VIGVLGKSSSKVYLAKKVSGELVTIKMPMDASDPWLDITWEYEKYASLYFKQKNLSIVQVIDFGKSDGMSVMIKEYRPGLTYKEVNELNWVLPQAFIDKLIKTDLGFTRSKFLNEIEGLQTWLWREGIVLGKGRGDQVRTLLSNMVEHGDLGDHNFLFDPIKREWFCIDP
jgi:serine/threonine protein kinase